MENQIIEQLTAATSKSYETMKSLGDINSSTLRKITDLQFEFISMNVESGIEQAKSLNTKTDAKEYFESTSEFVSDYNEKVLGYANQTVEIFTATSDEAKSLIEKAMAKKAAPAKKPAKAKATKAKSASKKAVKKAA
jgi:phasin family protein